MKTRRNTDSVFSKALAILILGAMIAGIFFGLIGIITSVGAETGSMSLSAPSVITDPWFWAKALYAFAVICFVLFWTMIARVKPPSPWGNNEYR